MSTQFDNRPDCYKTVATDRVLGYVVLGGGPGSAASVYPLYEAFMHLPGRLMVSYEQGARLNDYSFQTDFQGCTLATIAAQAIAALEARRSSGQLPLKRQAPQGVKKGSSSRKKGQP